MMKAHGLLGFTAGRAVVEATVANDRANGRADDRVADDMLAEQKSGRKLTAERARTS